MLGIGHVHLKVSNLKRAEDFYKKLGFKVRERFGNYIFMTLGKKHHDLALQEIPNAEIPDENSTGLYHFAIEIKDLKELATVYFNLRKQNINIRIIDCYSIKPIDREALIKCVNETKNKTVITVEDHFEHGGLGDFVLSALSNTGAEVFKIAVKKISRSGTKDELLNYAEIDSINIINKVKQLLA